MPMTSRPLFTTALMVCFGLAGCGEEADSQSETTVRSLPTPLSERTLDHSIAITYKAPGPAHVRDAKEGQALAAARYKATPTDPRGPGWRFPSRVEPITWDYETCTNARTLIPSPMEGWGLENSTSPGEWPIGDDFARLVLTKIGEPHDPPSLGRGSAGESTSIYISSGTPSEKSMQDMLDHETLRDTIYEPGPYNYPVRKGPKGYVHQEVLLGGYRVLIQGNNADEGEYFRRIIKCAIDNGLIADGIDVSTLRETP